MYLSWAWAGGVAAKTAARRETRGMVEVFMGFEIAEGHVRPFT
jgi:hypothetical protein